MVRASRGRAGDGAMAKDDELVAAAMVAPAALRPAAYITAGGCPQCGLKLDSALRRRTLTLSSLAYFLRSAHTI